MRAWQRTTSPSANAHERTVTPCAATSYLAASFPITHCLTILALSARSASSRAATRWLFCSRADTTEIRPDWDLSKPGLREAWEAGDHSQFHGWDRRASEN